MAAQDNDDFLEEELIGQHIVFPPEVIEALDKVNSKLLFDFPTIISIFSNRFFLVMILWTKPILMLFITSTIFSQLRSLFPILRKL